MAHSREAHGKMAAMGKFNEGHWEKKEGDLDTSDLKYTKGEMSNPEHLMKSNNALSAYAKKNQMKY